MKDLELFKKRFLLSTKSIKVDDEKQLAFKTMYGSPVLGDTLYLVVIQRTEHDGEIPHFVLSPLPVRESDLDQLIKEYYYLRKMQNGSPVFTKRMFPEFVLNPLEFEVKVESKDNAVIILRKAFEVLGCGVLKKDVQYIDDAKELNNRITEIVVPRDVKSTQNIIDEIFVDYVKITQDKPVVDVGDVDSLTP